MAVLPPIIHSSDTRVRDQQQFWLPSTFHPQLDSHGGIHFRSEARKEPDVRRPLFLPGREIDIQKDHQDTNGALVVPPRATSWFRRQSRLNNLLPSLQASPVLHTNLDWQLSSVDITIPPYARAWLCRIGGNRPNAPRRVKESKQVSICDFGRAA